MHQIHHITYDCGKIGKDFRCLISQVPCTHTSGAAEGRRKGRLVMEVGPNKQKKIQH